MIVCAFKQRLTVTVDVVACRDGLIPWGDPGQAAMMAFAYTDPRTGKRVTVEQAVRVAHPSTWEPRSGCQAAILCWGILRSGLLRHPVLT